MGTGTNWLKSLVGPAHARMWTECVNCEWYLYQAQFMTVQYEKQKKYELYDRLKEAGLRINVDAGYDWDRDRQIEWVEGRTWKYAVGLTLIRLAGWLADQKTTRHIDWGDRRGINIFLRFSAISTQADLWNVAPLFIHNRFEQTNKQIERNRSDSSYFKLKLFALLHWSN